MMPKRALLKTFVLNKKDEFNVLNDKIGKNNFEDIYGGDLTDFQNFNVEDYFESGKKYQFNYSNNGNKENSIDNIKNNIDVDINYINKEKDKIISINENIDNSNYVTKDIAEDNNDILVDIIVADNVNAVIEVEVEVGI